MQYVGHSILRKKKRIPLKTCQIITGVWHLVDKSFCFLLTDKLKGSGLKLSHFFAIDVYYLNLGNSAISNSIISSQAFLG